MSTEPPNRAISTSLVTTQGTTTAGSQGPLTTTTGDFRLPNTQISATYQGLSFALAQSREFVASKIIEAPLIPEQTLSLGFGLNLGMGAISALKPPVIDFYNSTWTEAGLEVNVEIHSLSAVGSLEVSAPESEGQLQLKGGGVFRLGVSMAVEEGRLVVKVVKLDSQQMNLVPTISIGCVNPNVWNSIPCGIIGALNGQVPGWLVDSLVFFFESSIENMLKAIVEFKLNLNLARIPDKFPLAFQHQTSRCLQLAFTMLGLSNSHDVKSASLEALALNTCSDREKFPVPGLVPAGELNRSMFTLAVSGSVPNSILYELHQGFLLTHVVSPADIPADSVLGLDTNSLALAFYCPWLSTKYAFQCPLWRPCPVSATIRTSGPPQVVMNEKLVITFPLSVDFNLLGNSSSNVSNSSNSSEFLWRINLTANATFVPSIAGSGCRQMLDGHLESLDASWISVTKTQDDSWVATALSINIFLPLLLSPLEDMINEHLADGVPLKPLPVGDSSYALADSSIMVRGNSLVLSTDILLAQECWRQKSW